MLKSAFKFGAILVVATLCATPLYAMPDIQVQGLFSGRAMISIDGNIQLLKDGETSPEGVKLVAADSKQATIEYQGAVHTLALSDRIGANYEQPSVQEVRLSPDARGHYMARANINGRYIEVMVDTGATLIAMNSRHADQLGIRYEGAPKSYASTASGVVETRLITLRSVSIGGVTRNSVRASVIEGDFPTDILLGNSFLSGFDMSVDSGVMVLKQKM